MAQVPSANGCAVLSDVTILAEFPPNIDQIRKAFRLSGAEIFAWDGTIYAPKSTGLPLHLIEHEKVHFRQQREAGGPQAWWSRYIEDPQFRLDQEMEATIVEFQVYSATHGRKQRRSFLDVLARRLSSPMYGGMITTKVAKARIKKGS